MAIALVLLVTLANLRGVKEAGTLFAIPTYGFVVIVGVTLVVGLAKCVGGCPQAATANLPIVPVVSLSVFLLLRAFASGATALTGVEAIADGVQAFRRPQAKNAADTLLIMASCFGDAGPEVDAGRERMRRYGMQYASASTHRDSFARSIPNLPAVEASWQAGDRAKALELISDDSVDLLAPLGAEAIAQRVRDLHAAGIDLPIMVTTAARPGDGDGPLATIAAAAGALGLATAANREE